MDLTMPAVLGWVLGGNVSAFKSADRKSSCRIDDKPKAFKESVRHHMHVLLSMLSNNQLLKLWRNLGGCCRFHDSAALAMILRFGRVQMFQTFMHDEAALLRGGPRRVGAGSPQLLSTGHGAHGGARGPRRRGWCHRRSQRRQSGRL